MCPVLQITARDPETPVAKTPVAVSTKCHFCKFGRDNVKMITGIEKNKKIKSYKSLGVPQILQKSWRSATMKRHSQ